MKNIKISLIIPCFNEQECLPLVIPPLFDVFNQYAWEVEVILVNNGSTDLTNQIISQLQKIYPQIIQVNLSINQLYGGGVQAGLKLATGDIIGHMCADGQISAVEVSNILMQAIELYPLHSCFVAKAKRIHHHNLGLRNLSSMLWKNLFSTLFGRVCSDVNATPKFYSRKLLDKMIFKTQGDFFDAELMVQAKSWQSKIVEIHTHFYPRIAGQSKVGKKFIQHSFNFIWDALKFKWNT